MSTTRITWRVAPDTSWILPRDNCRSELRQAVSISELAALMQLQLSSLQLDTMNMTNMERLIKSKTPSSYART